MARGTDASPSDGELLRAFRLAGDERAFDMLMSRHTRLIRNIARSVLGDDNQTEDVVQTTFMTLVRNCSKFKDDDSIGGWVHLVALRLARDERRKGLRRRKRERKVSMRDVESDAIAGLSEPTSAALHEELENLSEKYRMAIIMHHYEGLGYEEAASRLGCKYSTFKMRLTRARDELRKRLIKRGVEWGPSAVVAALGQSVSTAACSPEFIAATAKAAKLFAAGKPIPASLVSARVVAMAERGLKMLFWAKVKTVATLCALGLVVGLSAVALAFLPSLAKPQGQKDQQPSAGGLRKLTPVAPSEVRQAGSVWAWGMNDKGQLGDGTTTERHNPVPVPGLDGVIAVGAGYGRTVALKSDGTVVAWGVNHSGELGDGTTMPRLRPVPVSGLSGIVAIDVGDLHTVALKNDGGVWAWGHNADGQLGDGTTNNRATPAPVPGLSEVLAIAAGQHHTVALKRDQTVWAWGRNYNGQLGDGTRPNNRLLPVQVTMADGSPLRGVMGITAGYEHTVALKSDGSVWAWGGGIGEGGGRSASDRLTPMPVNLAGGSSLSGVMAIAAGVKHTVALKSDHTVWGWGENLWGKLGSGVTSRELFPVQAKLSDGSPLSGITAIATGLRHTLARKEDGTLWAWGANSYGQLGDGTVTRYVSVGIPVQVKKQDGTPLGGIIAVAAGFQHSVAIVGE